jgi:hypothetical protein
MKQLPVSFVWEAGWALENVWARRRREIILDPAGNRTGVVQEVLSSL